MSEEWSDQQQQRGQRLPHSHHRYSRCCQCPWYGWCHCHHLQHRCHSYHNVIPTSIFATARLTPNTNPTTTAEIVTANVAPIMAAVAAAALAVSANNQRQSSLPLPAPTWLVQMPRHWGWCTWLDMHLLPHCHSHIAVWGDASILCRSPCKCHRLTASLATWSTVSINRRAPAMCSCWLKYISQFPTALWYIELNTE